LDKQEKSSVPVHRQLSPQPDGREKEGFMPRETFDRELQRLQDDILALGSIVENTLMKSVEILKRRDMEGSQRLIAHDRLINEKRFAIEADALVLIATQQPMAGDLRTIAAVLDIVSELERIGDYAKGIAKINLMMGEKPLLKPLIDVPRMAEKARDMLHRALDAFIRRDVDLARAIPAEDDEIDGLYNQVYRELLTYIISDPRTIDQATYLLWVAHNLERAADRVTNICERVVFTVTGEMVEMDVENSGIEGVG
jgi:phosphate transport system protein